MTNFDYSAHPRAEVPHGVVQNSLSFAFNITLLRVWSLVRNLEMHRRPIRIAQIVRRDLPRIAVFPPNHEGRIDHNPGEPGEKAGSPMKALDMYEGPQKGILKRIFGVFAIPGNAKGGLKQPLPISSEQYFECFWLSSLYRR